MIPVTLWHDAGHAIVGLKRGPLIERMALDLNNAGYCLHALPRQGEVYATNGEGDKIAFSVCKDGDEYGPHLDAVVALAFEHFSHT